MSKYGNRRTTVDGHTFHSAAEARRYGELKLALLADEISHLVLQPRYRLDVHGVHICDYVADFKYRDTRNYGALVVEDVKSKPTMTPAYRLKKKLMKAIYGIEIFETE